MTGSQDICVPEMRSSYTVPSLKVADTTRLFALLIEAWKVLLDGQDVPWPSAVMDTGVSLTV